MNFASKAALALALLGLAACNNPNKYGKGVVDPGGSYGSGAATGNGVGGARVPLGNINDPNSPAYFNGRVGDMVHFVVDQSTLSPEAIPHGERLKLKRLVAHELIWPDGRPHSVVDKVDRQVPFLPHIRTARIVRADRRQFRVYDGGLTKTEGDLR